MMNSFFTTFIWFDMKKLIKIEYTKELEIRNIIENVKKEYGINENIILSFKNMNTECEIPSKYLCQYLLQYNGDSNIIIEIECTEPEPEPEPEPLPIIIATHENYGHQKHNGFSTVEELQTFLQNNFSIILHNYKRKQMLENREKIDIVKGIIKNILDPDPTRTLSSRDFIRIDLFLHKIFPKYDIETFYKPHAHGQKTEGKLWDSYNNYRTVLARAGLIVRRKRTKPINTQNNNIGNNRNTPTTDPLNLDDETLESIEYFNELLNIIPEDTSTIPWKWVNSFDTRMKLLQSNITIIEYIKKFPVLSRDDGYKLAILDTEKLYGVKPRLDSWIMGIYKKIIENARKSRNESVKEIITKIDTAPEKDKSSFALLLLAYAIPNLKRKRSVAGVTRFSKEDIQNSFISHFLTTKEANDFDREYSDKCFLEGISIHPKVILIGSPIFCARVTLGDLQYTIKNSNEAIEACISLFLGLNIQYPSENQPIWYFLQKYIFKITTNFDQKIAHVDTFASDNNITL